MVVYLGSIPSGKQTNQKELVRKINVSSVINMSSSSTHIGPRTHVTLSVLTLQACATNPNPKISSFFLFVSRGTFTNISAYIHFLYKELRTLSPVRLAKLIPVILTDIYL